MAAKKVSIGKKPNERSTTIDQWVEERTIEPVADDTIEPKLTMKRLTLDIPEPLHRAVKLKATMSGVPMADMLRDLLQKHYGV